MRWKSIKIVFFRFECFTKCFYHSQEILQVFAFQFISLQAFYLKIDTEIRTDSKRDQTATERWTNFCFPLLSAKGNSLSHFSWASFVRREKGHKLMSVVGGTVSKTSASWHRFSNRSRISTNQQQLSGGRNSSETNKNVELVLIVLVRLTKEIKHL